MTGHFNGYIRRNVIRFFCDGAGFAFSSPILPCPGQGSPSRRRRQHKMGPYRALATHRLQRLAEGRQRDAATLAKILERTWVHPKTTGRDTDLLSKTNKKTFSTKIDKARGPVVSLIATPNLGTRDPRIRGRPTQLPRQT